MAERLLEFAVHGSPQPRGSKQPFVLYKNRATKEPARREDGSIIVNMTDDNPESKAWMELVKRAGIAAWKRPPLEDVALEVACTFFMERPGYHYGTGKNRRLVKDGAPARPRVLPDIDKLARGTLDALTGVVWKDDQAIVALMLEKRYAVPKSATELGEGVVVRVELPDLQVARQLDFDLRQRWVPAGDDEPAPQDSLLA